MLHPKQRQEMSTTTTITNPDGSIYVGDVKDGKKDGQRTLRYASNDENGRKGYKGGWKNDQQDGQGKMIWTDDRIYEGEFQDRNPNGRGKYRWTNGGIYEGGFPHGKYESRQDDMGRW
jgi:hypothetical protein